MMPYRMRPQRREAKNDPGDVAELQEYLRALALESAHIPLISVDGIYGPETAQAVTAFQETAGLPATGRVERATWEALADAHRAVMERRAPPRAVNPFPREEVSLTLGGEGDAVAILQILLDALARRYENLPILTVTGRYDEQTAEAVDVFRGICGETCPTGQLDKRTWNLLVGAYHSVGVGQWERS